MNNDKKIKYWPDQKQKSWYSFVVDGFVVGVLQESKALDKERKRLSGLCGITVRPATPFDLIKFNAKTVLPRKILSVMSSKSFSG